MGIKTYLKVGSELLYDGFPGNETLYEDICRFKIL
jgi:hypothetical protein